MKIRAKEFERITNENMLVNIKLKLTLSTIHIRSQHNTYLQNTTSLVISKGNQNTD